MNEEQTRDLPDRRSFEDRVFARFDSMDARFDSTDARFDSTDARTNAMEVRFEARFDRVDARFDRVDARLDGLDIRVQALEAKALDTKPIWERALVEIVEVKKGVDDINRKLDILNQDVLQVRADQRLVHKRMDAVESRLQ
jgi:tetrahydromethanopterin S-methyltransferase subunit G